ncbi:MAG: S-layer homology domain-containing protein [Halanaerobium sp.]
MKKPGILLLLILVLTLSFPLSAQSYKDVPSDHWAYDALNQLEDAGIVEGYPDGEYKGQRTMSRYEMSVMVSRALDNIAEEQEAMAEGLNRDQAQYVIEIVRILMEKNVKETITEAQAVEVVDIVEALTAEYKSELKVLGADFDVLARDIDQLEAEVDALDLPEDNIEFAVTAESIFEAADYKEDLHAAMWLWADADALDLDLPYLPETFADFENDFDPAADNSDDWEDADDLPSEKRFWQEYGININGSRAGADFNLDLDTVSNIFSEEDSAFGYQQNDQNDFKLDAALLNLSYDGELFNTLKAGDLKDYNSASYFVDEEDIQGVEIKTDYFDRDWTFLTAGFGAEDTDDIFVIKVSDDLDFAQLSAGIYQLRGTPGRITNYSLALDDIVLSEEAALNGEVVFNDSRDNDDLLFNLNGSYTAADDLSISAGFETVGEDFYAYKHDLEESSDYDEFSIEAEYFLNENNTFNAAYTLVRIGDQIKADENYGDEDKNIFELSLANKSGNFSNKAALEYTLNDDYADGYQTRLIELGTEYALSEKTEAAAALVNKNEDNDGSNVINYNYLKGNIKYKLSDSLSWNNEAKYILGEVGETEVEGESSSFTTSLSAEF